MRRSQGTYQYDWVTIVIYYALLLIGWIGIYAATYKEGVSVPIFSLDINSGRQMIWIFTSVFLVLVVLLIDWRVFEDFAYVFYAVIMFALLLVLVIAREVDGASSWLEIGPAKIQPSEFAKYATGLALARFLSSIAGRDLSKKKAVAISASIIGLPTLLILLQGDAGSALVFVAMILVLYRAGMTPIPLYIGVYLIILFLSSLLVRNLIMVIILSTITLILVGLSFRQVKRVLLIVIVFIISLGFIFSVDFILNDVLKPHQQARVLALVDPSVDPSGKGVSYQTTNSKITIGSGGLTGKGFLKGSLTQGDFVPAQSTDFIFSAIGEEYGWLGSIVLIGLFVTLFFRLLFLAERQKSTFARIYGYVVFTVLFTHFTLNIAMTIGLFPVIGIPLPFLSYGGSSLWSFTILLFIFLKLDAHRMQILER
ncbi:MAG: rod shape-determining protein RodA [Bacteroidota bacterium]